MSNPPVEPLPPTSDRGREVAALLDEMFDEIQARIDRDRAAAQKNKETAA